MKNFEQSPTPRESPRHVNPETQSPSTLDRRGFLRLAAIGAVAAAGVGTWVFLHEQAPAPPNPEQDVATFIQHAGQSLIDMHEVDPKNGGWKFKSAIQSPHYQTDRDVGAASVGMGFLSLAQAYPNQTQWLNAASHTADWLTSISHDDGKGGRYWSDYVDGQDESADTYTSFDDGAIGIGDFYWQLYEKSGKATYKDMALASVRWTLSQAEAGTSDSGATYRWRWNTSDPRSPYNTGMGMGASGIATALASFYERTKTTDPQFAAECKRYAEGAARQIDLAIDSMRQQFGRTGSLPEVDGNGDGNTAFNSGYLSGSAGAAYMYLALHQAFGDQQYLDRANGLFHWLDTDTAHGGPRIAFSDGSSAWKLMLDPEGGDDNTYASGFEEGNAGIGWAYLQAYNVTHDKQYLQSAKSAADWLVKAPTSSPDASPKDKKHTPYIIGNANLNRGAAGIGMFLRDTYLASGETKYDVAAQKALGWLMATAKTSSHGPYWNDSDEGQNFSSDPSWHWGSAGIIAAAIHISGGTQDLPGEQPSLKP